MLLHFLSCKVMNLLRVKLLSRKVKSEIFNHNHYKHVRILIYNIPNCKGKIVHLTILTLWTGKKNFNRTKYLYLLYLLILTYRVITIYIYSILNNVYNCTYTCIIINGTYLQIITTCTLIWMCAHDCT